MKVSRHELYRIIVEEYARDMGIDESQVDDLLTHIKGGPKPDWMDDDEQDVPDPPEVPPAPDQSDVTSSETYPMDIPSDDAPESEYQGHQNDSGPDVEDQLSTLIQGMDPEAVAELFQAVFEKIPGVELSRPGDEDYPGEETLYSPGAEGRPTAGFQLEALIELVREVLNEGHYHDMGGEGEMYDAIAAGAEERTSVQKMESAYHQLQDVFDTLEDEVAQDMARRIISDLETLMDTTEHPEDYRE
jgi:hypothetical protein